MSKPRKTEIPLPNAKPKTPIPLPGAKTKTPIPLPSTSKKTPIPLPSSKNPAPLSQEFVGDSDDSSDEAAATAGASQQKAPINIAVHPPKTNGVAKSPVEVRKKQKEAPKKAAKGVAASQKPAPKQVVAEDQGASSSSSDAESSDEAETDIRQAQQREAQKKKQTKDTSSSSDTSSDDSEEEIAPAAQKPSEREARPAQAQTQTVTFQQSRPYVPPTGFNPGSTERAAASAITNIFKDLKGKQIWHITAPEGVSLQELSRLAMDKARNGEAVLDHNGTTYGFSSVETAAGERAVMIPASNGYRAVPSRISQSFHVQQVINLPKLTSKQADQSTGSEAAASITASTIRSVKPQVKGLKMRFFPSGFENSAPATFGDSESEDDEPPPEPDGLGVPKGFDPPAKKEKRKHDQTNGEEEAEAPAKKHKKHRTIEEQALRDAKKARKEKKKEKKLKS